MTNIETTTIPGTDLKPSRVGLGTWAIGGWMWGGSDDAQSIRTIQAAVDRGITLIDTAPVYGFGHSEEIVGKALAEGGRRDKVVIATKVALDWKDGKPFRNASRARILKEIDDSLRRLQHRRDRSLSGALARSEHADRGNRRRARGSAQGGEDPRHRRQQFLAGADGRVPQRGAARTPRSRLIICSSARSKPTCCLMPATTASSTLAYGALCRGLLAGRMTASSKFVGDDLRRNDPKFQQPRFGQYLEAVEALDRFAQERYGKRVVHLAVRWILDKQGAGVALWGARKPEQLDPIAEVYGWTLDQAAMTEIDAILAKHVTQPIGPEFMAPPEKVAA